MRLDESEVGRRAFPEFIGRVSESDDVPQCERAREGARRRKKEVARRWQARIDGREGESRVKEGRGRIIFASNRVSMTGTATKAVTLPARPALDLL